MKKITIVILNWNGVNHLRNYLPRVISNTPADICDIVVADNGSTDNSREVIRDEFPDVALWEFDKNYGFAAGYNLAIDRVETPYTILLNSDAAPEKGWIEPLLALIESRTQIAAVMPKILADKNHDYFEYAGAAGGFIDSLGYPFCRGRIMNTIEKDNGQYNTPRKIFWATGAAMLVRTLAYRTAGGLDGDFFAHMEEIDLCWRMQLLGNEIWIEPNSIVYHLGGGTLNENSPMKTLLNHRNNLSMLYKNLDKSKLYPTILFRMVLDGLSGLMYLLQGRKQHFVSVIKAHQQFREALPTLKIKRKNIQNKRKANPSCIYKGAIILRYMLGKKYFPRQF